MVKFYGLKTNQVPKLRLQIGLRRGVLFHTLLIGKTNANHRPTPKWNSSTRYPYQLKRKFPFFAQQLDSRGSQMVETFQLFEGGLFKFAILSLQTMNRQSCQSVWPYIYQRGRMA